jgi:hypothetical protein
MGTCDEYRLIKTTEKEELFTELFELKEEKAKIDKRIKELEKGYKPMLEGIQNDLFFELRNGTKFSIKKSVRKGSIDAKALEKDGINVDEYRKPESTIYTLRKDK